MPNAHCRDTAHVRFKDKTGTGGKGGGYDNGPFCLECRIYWKQEKFDYKLIQCPCCGTKLRTKPRARKYKELRQEIAGVTAI